MTDWIKRIDSYSQSFLMAASGLLLVAIALLDCTSGAEISFIPLYLLPVMVGTWFVGQRFGVVMSILSIAVWIASELTTGPRYSSLLAPICNAFIALAFYLAVVRTLHSLRRLQRDLEARVLKRTIALTNEMQERLRLERELLEISEREQRRIGHDLHDSLCQHLTGTALAGQVLGEKLNEKALPETADAHHVVALIEEAIDLTRTLARGLHPMELEGEGFVDSFRELANSIGERFSIACKFECQEPVVIRDPLHAIHLYRIAQEAITNAIKHGKAQHIIIRMGTRNNVTTLSISDDGSGLSESARDVRGMGLRIMAYRASMMGAVFGVEPQTPRGTRVICTLPEMNPVAP